MSEILGVLVAHGVPSAIIDRVKSALEAQEALAALRAHGYQRLKRYRETLRNVSSKNASKVNKTETLSDNVSIPPSNTPPLSKQKPKKVSVSRRTAMPADWHPVIAMEDSNEFDRFRDYCKANGKTYADWDAAWRNWRTSPYRNAGQSNGKGRRHGSILDAADRLEEKFRQAGATGNYVPGSSGPRPLEMDQRPRHTGIRSLPKG